MRIERTSRGHCRLRLIPSDHNLKTPLFDRIGIFVRLTAEGDSFRSPLVVAAANPPGGSQELEAALAGVRGDRSHSQRRVGEDDGRMSRGAGEATLGHT